MISRGTRNMYTTPQSDRESVTSFLSVRLPSNILLQDASFLCFARTFPNGPRRVILSLETPLFDESILEIGTREGAAEIYASSIASEAVIHAGATVGAHGWTHVALIWHQSSRAVQVYVDGVLTKITALDNAEKLTFVQSITTWQLAIGRGKSQGKTSHGWDGEVRHAVDNSPRCSHQASIDR